jgi:hypothetical protein
VQLPCVGTGSGTTPMRLASQLILCPYILHAVRSSFSDEKKLSSVAFSQPLELLAGVLAATIRMVQKLSYRRR